MIETVKYQSCLRVLESWEVAKQRSSCKEEIGMTILIELFRVDASIKDVFGLRRWSLVEIESSSLLRMGLLVHGVNFVERVDEVLGLLGPDLESVAEVLQQHASSLVGLGVKPRHFGSLLIAMRQALKHSMGPAYTVETDDAWSEVLRQTSKTVIKAMV
jgi:Globin